MPRTVPNIIHYALLNQHGEAGAFCCDPPRVLDRDDNEHWILSKWLYDEVTCGPCRAKLGLPEEPSRGSLLRDNLEIRLNIAFQFVDANYWNRNVRKSGEQKLNPDPDGWLASQFLRLTNEFEEMMKPFVQMMEKHEGQFGWPEIVNDSPLPDPPERP